jgi:YesN/AraC family two-component response regulator
MPKLRAVIADDERWIRSLIRGLVDWEKFRIEIVGEAGDGITACNLCGQLNPDILMTDIRMPDMNGLELIEAIHSVCPDLRCIIISGYDDFQYAQRAIRLGALDYILKPVEQRELERVITRTIDDIKGTRRERKRIEQLQTERSKLEAIITEPEDGDWDDCDLDPRIARAVTYIDTHFASSPSLDEVADVAFMNRTYFSEIFKREMKIGYAEYVNTLKIEKAKVLLSNPLLKVCEIADMLGFASSSYFTRFFKRYTLKTPQQYRIS